jgi:hypothetical protein
MIHSFEKYEMSVKGIGSPDKYFFEGLEIKPVISVHAQMVLNF